MKRRAVVYALLLVALLAPVAVPLTASAQGEGYIHTIRPGDTLTTEALEPITAEA